MADANGNDANNQIVPEGQQQQQPEGFDPMEILRMLSLMILIQFAAQTAMSSFGIGQSAGIPNQVPVDLVNKSSLPPKSSSDNYFEATTRATSGAALSSTTKNKHNSLWSVGTKMDLDLYITEDKEFSYPLKKNIGKTKKRSILASWHEKDLIFDFSSSNTRNSSVTVDISQQMQANQTSLYAHIILKRKNNGEQEGVDDKTNIMQKSFLLTRLKFRKKQRYEISLLVGEESEGGEELDNRLTEADLKDNSILGKAARDFDQDVYLLYIKPVIDLHLVNFHQQFGPGSFNADAMKLFNFYQLDSFDKTDDSKDLKTFGYAVTSLKTKEPADYYPILHPSEFWLKDDALIPVNGTLKNVTINLDLSTVQMWKFTLMAQLEEQWRQQEKMSPGSTDSDMFRSILMDTNPILLGITFIVTILHSVFDFLAFKNDIKFFKGKRSMEGISVRSMVINAFFQVVIFLYLFDNETSTMILLSNGVGLLIEFWKISKAITFSFEEGRLQWQETSSYSKTKTKEYDEIATSHLLFVTFPLVLGYGIYSLVHQKHKGWYSWILNTLVGFIYMFGFVMMTPQLFINYKLQSVAHLNWRTMTYKSVNTFIDDLFAFVVKMPIMHRLACLRDDVIFVIFLYQRYKYRTDYTRVNEFGQCEEPTEEMLQEAKKEGDGTKVATPTNNEEVMKVQPTLQSNSNGNIVNRRRGARDK